MLWNVSLSSPFPDHHELSSGFQPQVSMTTEEEHMNNKRTTTGQTFEIMIPITQACLVKQSQGLSEAISLPRNKKMLFHMQKERPERSVQDLSSLKWPKAGGRGAGKGASPYSKHRVLRRASSSGAKRLRRDAGDQDQNQDGHLQQCLCVKGSDLALSSPSTLGASAERRSQPQRRAGTRLQLPLHSSLGETPTFLSALCSLTPYVQDLGGLPGIS